MPLTHPLTISQQITRQLMIRDATLYDYACPHISVHARFKVWIKATIIIC